MGAPAGAGDALLPAPRLPRTVLAGASCCGGCQGNHLLFLYVLHVTRLRKGSGVVGPGQVLEAMPSGLGWTPWPEGPRPTSLSVEQEAAAKERRAPAVSPDPSIHSLIRSFIHFIRHRRCWALG